MAIVINGSGTVTGLSVGGLPDGTVDEGTLATDSVTAAKIPASLENTFVSGRKNMVINGAMNVAQRGTSTTGVGTTGFFACDRVKLYAGGGSSSSRYTVTQSTDSPTGFNYSYKIDCTTANASPSAGHNTYLRLGIIEKQDLVNTKFGTSSAESLTLSFWVKSNITGSQQVLFANHVDQKHAGGTFTISSADTWEKKTITVSGDTVNSFDATNPTSLALTFDMFLEAGSTYYGGTAQGDTWGDRTENTKAVNRLNISSSTSNYINITGVQLELGSTATDFEYRSYGEELALCQRYYYTQATAGSGEGYTYVLDGNHYPLLDVNFPVTMRVDPTYSGTTSGSSWFRIDSTTNTYGAWHTISGARVTNDGAIIQLNQNTSHANYTLGTSGWCDSRAGTITLSFDAEL